MAFFNGWPWTQFQEHNLDWIIKKLKDLEEQIIETDVDPIARAGVAANAQDISNLTTEVSNNKTTAHNEAVAASNAAALAQGTADANTAALNRQTLAGRKFIFIGDSYDAGWTPDGTYPGWGERAAAVLKKTIGVDYWNQYIGGGGFGFADSNPQSFYYQLKDLGDSMTAATKNSITDIVFGGGRNDADINDIPTINSGIRSCADYIAANFPNAKVWLFAIGWDGIETNKIKLLTVYYESYSRAVDYKNWVYRELFQYLQQRNYLGSDRKHPNSDGNYLLGNQIGNILCGSEKTDATRELDLNWNVGGTIITGSKALRLGDYIVLNIKEVTFLTPNHISHTAYTSNNIEVQCPYIIGTTSGTALPFTLAAILTCTINGETKFIPTDISAKLLYYSADPTKVMLTFKHQAINLDNSNYIVDNTITNIELLDQTVVLPIINC